MPVATVDHGGAAVLDRFIPRLACTCDGHRCVITRRGAPAAADEWHWATSIASRGARALKSVPPQLVALPPGGAPRPMLTTIAIPRGTCAGRPSDWHCPSDWH